MYAALDERDDRTVCHHLDSLVVQKDSETLTVNVLTEIPTDLIPGKVSDVGLFHL